MDKIISDIAKISNTQDSILREIKDQGNKYNEFDSLLRSHGISLAKQEEILKNQEKTLGLQHQSLEVHIKRTDIAEQGIKFLQSSAGDLKIISDDIRSRTSALEKISIEKAAAEKKQADIFKWVIGVAGFLVTVIGIWQGILTLLAK